MVFYLHACDPAPSYGGPLGIWAAEAPLKFGIFIPFTVKPLLSGHPLLNGHFSHSQKNEDNILIKQRVNHIQWQVT